MCPTCGSVYRLGTTRRLSPCKTSTIGSNRGGTVISQTRRPSPRTRSGSDRTAARMGRFKKTEVLEKVASIRATLKNGVRLSGTAKNVRQCTATRHLQPTLSEMHSLENLARGAETVTDAQEIAQFDRGCESVPAWEGCVTLMIYPHVSSGLHQSRPTPVAWTTL